MTDPDARKHLVDALAFALAHRVPKGLLRDAGRARGDEVALRAIAAALADHVELGNIRYHLGPPGAGAHDQLRRQAAGVRRRIGAATGE